jgi:hypothetical protein
MDTLIKQIGSANEKNIEELIEETKDWNQKLQIISVHLTFMDQLISADIFQKNIPNIFENLFTFSKSLTVLKTEKIDLHQTISNHKIDITGMMECEDISCETFYYSQHQTIETRIRKFISNFNEYQTELFGFCTNKFRISN